MPDELIDIYDEHNKPLGQTKMKSVAHREGLWHRAVHVFVYDDDGSVLLQKRSDDRDVNPGLWSPAAAGHVSAGETLIETAIREAQEEIGLSLREDDFEKPLIRKLRLRHSPDFTNAEFKYIFFVCHPIGQERYMFQESEVSDLKILLIDELEQAFENDPDAFSFEGDGYWERAFAEIRKRLSDVTLEQLRNCSDTTSSLFI